MESESTSCMVSSTEESIENVDLESLQDKIMSPCEEDLIIRLHNLLGDRWPLIAGRIPGRTAAEVERYCKWKWNGRIEVQAESSSKMKIVKPVC